MEKSLSEIQRRAPFASVPSGLRVTKSSMSTPSKKGYCSLYRSWRGMAAATHMTTPPKAA